MIWLKDGKPVATGDGLCQTNQDPRRCKLNMYGQKRLKLNDGDFLSSDKSKRGDTGKYELVLKNAKGEVKVPIDVTVLGKD